MGPHVFYMLYMNILYVIGCKNIHTVLLKLYNQFYVNILYEIVCKNVHAFIKKNIWTPRVFLIFLRFFERILYKSNCIISIFSWCATHTKIRSKLVVIVTAGSQKITLWGPQRTPLGILGVNALVVLSEHLSTRAKEWNAECSGRLYSGARTALGSFVSTRPAWWRFHIPPSGRRRRSIETQRMTHIADDTVSPPLCNAADDN